MTSSEAPRRKIILWAMALLVAMSAIPFLPMFQNRFVWDDHEFIVRNPAIKGFFPVARFFQSQGRVEQGAIYPVAGARPVTTLSLAIDYAFWRLKPFGYHLTNLLLHLLCVLGAFILLRRLTGDLAAAWFGAVLFAVLPGHAEAVIALFGRADLLATLFVIGGFYAYLRSRNRPDPASSSHSPAANKPGSMSGGRSTWCWYAMSVAGFLLACFSKEMGLVLLGLIAVYEFFIGPRKNGREIMVRLAPFIVIGILYWIYRGRALGGNAAGAQWWGGGPLKNFLMMFEVYARYLRILLLPVVLSPLHLVKVPNGAFDLSVLAGFALWAGSLVFVAVELRRRRVTGLFGGWFLVALIPVANIIPIPGLYMAEKWLYLPSLGLCGLAGYALARLLARRARTAAAVFGIAAVLFSARIFFWNRAWRDDGSVGRAIVRTSPESHLGRNMFGKDLLDRGRNREAEAEFRKAIAIKPGYYLAHSNLAMALNYQNRYPEAEAEYRLTLRLNPGYAEAYSNLGVVLWLTGRNEEAAAELRTAVRMDSMNPYFRYNLASILKRSGRIPEALAEYRKTVELDPSHADAQINIGIILGMTGRVKEAEDHFRRLLRENPKNADLRFNFALALDTQGKNEEAAVQYLEYLKLQPDSPIRPRIEARIRQLSREE